MNSHFRKKLQFGILFLWMTGRLTGKALADTVIFSEEDNQVTETTDTLVAGSGNQVSQTDESSVVGANNNADGAGRSSIGGLNNTVLNSGYGVAFGAGNMIQSANGSITMGLMNGIGSSPGSVAVGRDNYIDNGENNTVIGYRNNLDSGTGNLVVGSAHDLGQGLEDNQISGCGENVVNAGRLSVKLGHWIIYLRPAASMAKKIKDLRTAVSTLERLVMKQNEQIRVLMKHRPEESEKTEFSADMGPGSDRD